VPESRDANRSRLRCRPREGAGPGPSPWKLGFDANAPTAAGAIVGPGDHPDVVYEVLRSDDQIPAVRAQIATLEGYIVANAPTQLPLPTIWILHAGRETQAVKDLQAELGSKVHFLIADV